MADSNLPTLKNKDLPAGLQFSVLETRKSIRTNRALMACGLIATTGAVMLFLLTQYAIFSALLGFAGLIFFVARQLVRKSLALTANRDQRQIGSIDIQLEQIRMQVSKCKFLESVEAEGTQAARQADQLLHQYKILKAILNQKLETTEMTFSRYLGSIEASCLSIGENLTHTKSMLENLSLTGKNQTDQWNEQRSQVVGLLKSTDEALLVLANLFSSVNEITTKEKHRDQLEQSMLEVEELADRAKIYSKQ
jgi:hypothetical protein